MRRKYFNYYCTNWRNQWRKLKKISNKKVIHKYLCNLTFLFFLVFGSCLLVNSIALISAYSKPVDVLFVLGGSIQREIYVATQATEHIQHKTQTKILISSGSPDPCIKLIFQRDSHSSKLTSLKSTALKSTSLQTNLQTKDLQTENLQPRSLENILENVWLEKCAKSTFGNFYYSIPILKKWRVHKVKLITSSTHLPRAKWMAQILLGSHGIWVEPDIITEKGVPGNRESWLKTSLDLTRSLLWAIVSQFTQPQCGEVVKLTDVDMDDWIARGFKCEYQGRVKIPRSKSPRSRSTGK